jgi:integrase
MVSKCTKLPCQESDFQHRFAAIHALAGLDPALKFRLFRHTLATALGAAGRTNDQIRSVTGHATRDVVARYVQPDQAFAKGAMRRLQAAERRTKRATR